MPRANQAKAEAALSLEMKNALNEACRLEEVSRWHWIDEPTIAPFFIRAALLSLAERLEDEGATSRQALRKAAAELGLDPDSVERSEFRRKARRRASDSVSCTQEADAA